MDDALRGQINQALGEHLDPDIFEECACSLLRELYPTIVCVPGGQDQGADAIVPSAEGGGMFLVATTSSKLLENLRRNLQSRLDSGRLERKVIVATSRVIKGKTEGNLYSAALELGFELKGVYERTWWVETLHQRSDWRKRLLHLSGAPSALSSFPSRERLRIQISLIGRDEEVQALNDSEGDLILAGRPGVGKTFLLQELVGSGWGLFVVDLDAERIADAIRDINPRRVILDDAHFSLDGLSRLVQVRRQIDSNVAIIATTWPSRIDEVKEPRGTRCPRSRTGSLVAGQHPSSRDESRGGWPDGTPAADRRPGSRSAGPRSPAGVHVCERGYRRCRKGEALHKTLASYWKAVGKESSAILGVLALGGSSGLPLDFVADVLTMDKAKTQALVTELASGGIIDDAGWGRLKVQPDDLQFALVREVFFGAAPLDVGAISLLLPEPSNAVVPLVGATHRGAVVNPALLERLLDGCNDCTAWEAYATLGEHAAEFALDNAPEQCTVGIAGTALYSAPRLGLRSLMEAAIGDNRARHSYPDHPMRRIDEYAAGTASDLLERRRQISKAAAAWLDEGRPPEPAVEALSYALRPGIRRQELDPGAGRTVSFLEAALREDLLPEFRPLWDQLVAIVAQQPLRSYEHVLRVLGEWCYQTRVTMNPEVDENWRKVAHQEVRRVMKDLIRVAPNRIGLRASLSRLSKQAALRVGIKEDAEFAALFPPDRYTTFDEQTKAEQNAASRLVRWWKGLTPEAVADKIVHLEKEAHSVQITYPRVTPYVVELLGSKRPLEYLFALRDCGASRDLFERLIRRIVETRIEGWEATADGLLDDERTRAPAVWVCLTSATGSRLARKAVGLIRVSGVRVPSMPFLHQIGSDAIEPLLMQDDLELLQDAVIALMPPRAGSLPGRLQQLWEEAVLRCPAEGTWWPELMKGRDNLLVRWTLAWNSRARVEGAFEPFPEGLAARVQELGLKHRLQLLDGLGPCWGLDIVIGSLVGDDEEIMRRLLTRDDLKQHRGAALRGMPDDGWFRRALTALEAGCDPGWIVANCALDPGTWISSWGDESSLYQQRAEAFEAFLQDRDRRRRRIAETGVAYFRRRADEERNRERRAAVRWA